MLEVTQQEHPKHLRADHNDDIPVPHEQKDAELEQALQKRQRHHTQLQKARSEKQKLAEEGAQLRKQMEDEIKKMWEFNQGNKML